MAIVINGSGTVTGLAVGGLPDGTVDTDTLANTTVTAAKVAADVATQSELDAKPAISATAPSSPSQGDMWFNTSASTVSNIASKCMASYSGTEWLQMSNKFSASGGTETTYTAGGNSYKVHTFTSSGTFTAAASGTVDFLVIAGGGGGGGTTAGGGGGGAGGYRNSVSGELSGGSSSAESSLVVSAQSYSVTIGAGGVGQANGNSSIFSTITSIGGGHGGTQSSIAGQNGGSGGGEGRDGTHSPGSGTTGQGKDGGSAPSAGCTSAGGGGGAGYVGYNGYTSDCADLPSGTTRSQGGAGLSSSITGTAVTRTGGGGGSWWESTNSVVPLGGAGGGGNGKSSESSINPTNGAVNTGSGGGGGDNRKGGTVMSNGGSGIVIIRYEI